ncbi:hypothetical protein COU20_03890 [Candidatus Kaiserbacteria bacterium CG10_big_fil_rev_8_21_14_0_10_59_10]|uniref:RNHCP domain-containing protein n=1 Tax=Candidatus Kaiserbacteria bacterium CG10_big_fil_rev_8_21_14_0_10_59_10 TaxID=1974612 RepID=A0A2H0U772_9BACT|nr:MAG: hypothetical protein COU20_03890 [Candidatus Kaiserbacteria bacterium CG10_big_fil_rev_8_21_14_0_10_59_10]
MDRGFQKREENFQCENCGCTVTGDGYTNHCPQCLWSKHVDVNPGDRAAECRGMMRPVRVESRSGEHRIVHRCVACGKEQPNRAARGDSPDALVSLSSAG